MADKAGEFTRCPDCPKTFAKGMDYNRHRKQHERPYPCTLCKKTFALNADLKRHRVTHRESKPRFLCTYLACTFKGASRKDYLLKHMRTCHQPPGTRAGEKSKTQREHYCEALRRVQGSTLEELEEKNLQFLETVFRGDLEAVQEWLAEGACPYATDSKSKSVFAIAIERGHINILTLLLEATTPMWTGNTGDLSKLTLALTSSLLIAVNLGSLECSTLVLDHGADPNRAVNIMERGFDEQTALNVAVKIGSRSLVKLLLEREAKLPPLVEQALYGYQKHPLSVAINTGLEDIVEMFTQSYPDSFNAQFCTYESLMKAIRFNEPKIIQFILDHGAPVEAHENRLGDQSALLFAAIFGQLDTVKLLLARGADVNKRSGHNLQTALHACSYPGGSSIDMVELLIQSGANIHIQNV